VDLLATIHQYTGYAIVLVVLVLAVLGFGRAKDAREFTPGPYVIGAVLLDIQVLAGLVLYGMGGYWEHPSALVRYLHPRLALLALVAAHVGVKRARGQQMAVVDEARTAVPAAVVAAIGASALLLDRRARSAGAVSVGLYG
jgi:hypothetical protein